MSRPGPWMAPIGGPVGSDETVGGEKPLRRGGGPPVGVPA